METKTKEHRNVYEVISDKIISQLEQNIVPWQKPWTSAGLPTNLITMKPYRGVNVWLLASENYERNYFLTFNQAKELGAQIKKGEKGHIIAFWKQDEVTNDETGETKLKSILRYYYVFNIQQCENIPPSKIPAVQEKQNNPIKVCERIVKNMPQKPDISHKEHRAFYHPKKDVVNVPNIKYFSDSQGYYGTLFHELIHSTGHEKRLNRKEVMDLQPFGTATYSMEELTAEIGACYLNNHAGISVSIENNIAYIQSWLKKLKNDKRFIVQASAHAQRAADFILGMSVTQLLMEGAPSNSNNT